MILSSVEALLDQANAEHIRRAKILEAIMIERVGLAAPPRFGAAEHPPRSGPY